MTLLEHTPVFAICGYSGAGKTTLIVELLAHLRARGLATLVIKHDAHGLSIDQPGKDSDRLFGAGADVLARDARQSLLRLHAGDLASLAAIILRARAHYDVILVEGHKATPLPRKLWLRRHPRDRVPQSCRPVALDLQRGDDQGSAALRWIDRELARIARRAPTLAGVLIGGSSRRMGESKHLLRYRGRSWLSRIAAAAAQAADGVVLLGAGRLPPSLAHLPRVPDVADAGGPLAGMRAAARWRPDARWLFLACDTPLITSEALLWLREQSRPGVWAVLPRLHAGAAVEPLPGWYDLRAALWLESAAGPSDLARYPRTVSPVVPTHLGSAWRNCNTPADVRRLASASGLVDGTARARRSLSAHTER
jgi:molybdopterin-guanine dinucleotide biosynthesis protein A